MLIHYLISYPNSLLDAIAAAKTQHLQQKLATAEAHTAHLATEGSETKKYGPGVKAKTPRSTDHTTKLDEMADTMKDRSGEMTGVMKELVGKIAATGPMTESPSTKRHRGLKDISDLILGLINERRVRLDAKMSIVSVDKEIEILEQERSQLNHTQYLVNPSTNLAGAMNLARYDV